MSETTAKRLIFVTSRLPWPTNSGRKVSLYHYCRGLHERYGYEITLFVFPEHDQPRNEQDKPDFISRVAFAAPFSRAEQAGNLLIKSLFGGRPLQAALFESRKSKRLLDRLVAEIKPDVMIFDMIRLAPYMKRYQGKTRLVLDLDDLLSVRYRRQLQASAEGSIAGRYEGALHPLTRRMLGAKFSRFILKTEARRVKRAEIKFSKKADGVILVSEGEVAHLNALLGESKAITVPTGVDIAAFSAARGMAKIPNTVGFVGNLSVPANVASLTHITEHVLPLLADVSLEVVGPTPEEIREKYKGNPQISLLGEVDNLPEALGRWQVFLAPITFGTGLKTKILEAMAAGLPVVTNAVGAEGIGAGTGSEILLAESAEAQAAAVKECLESPEKATEIGNAAAAFAAAHFAWEKCFAAFEALDL